jgi:predicted CoA-binding protein
MNSAIEKIINSKKIAVVGVSQSKQKMGNGIFKGLKENGYTVYPVHPSADMVEGEKAYPNLKALPEPVESIVIATSPKNVDGVIDEAIAVGIKNIWFQQGPNFSAAVKKAQDAGIETVSKKCILMYAPPVKSIHKVHRFFAKVFGRY